MEDNKSDIEKFWKIKSLDIKHKGILIYGTAGEFPSDENLKDMFYNPHKWFSDEFSDDHKEEKFFTPRYLDK